MPIDFADMPDVLDVTLTSVTGIADLDGKVVPVGKLGGDEEIWEGFEQFAVTGGLADVLAIVYPDEALGQWRLSLNITVDTDAPPPASASTSTIVPSPTSGILANGVDVSTVTVTLRTASNVLLPGKALTISNTGDAVAISEPAVTDADGVAVFTMANPTAEAVTFSVNVTTDDVDVGPSATVTYGSFLVDEGQSTMTFSAVEDIGETGRVVITITLKNAAGAVLPGKSVELGAHHSTPDNYTYTPFSQDTDVNGVTEFIALNAGPANVYFSARIASDDVILEDGPVEFPDALLEE